MGTFAENMAEGVKEVAAAKKSRNFIDYRLKFQALEQQANQHFRELEFRKDEAEKGREEREGVRESVTEKENSQRAEDRAEREANREAAEGKWQKDYKIRKKQADFSVKIKDDDFRENVFRDRRDYDTATDRYIAGLKRQGKWDELKQKEMDSIREKRKAGTDLALKNYNLNVKVQGSIESSRIMRDEIARATANAAIAEKNLLPGREESLYRRDKLDARTIAIEKELAALRSQRAGINIGRTNIQEGQSEQGFLDELKNINDRILELAAEQKKIDEEAEKLEPIANPKLEPIAKPDDKKGADVAKEKTPEELANEVGFDDEPIVSEVVPPEKESKPTVTPTKTDVTKDVVGDGKPKKKPKKPATKSFKWWRDSVKVSISTKGWMTEGGIREKIDEYVLNVRLQSIEHYLGSDAKNYSKSIAQYKKLRDNIAHTMDNLDEYSKEVRSALKSLGADDPIYKEMKAKKIAENKEIDACYYQIYLLTGGGSRKFGKMGLFTAPQYTKRMFLTNEQFDDLRAGKFRGGGAGKFRGGGAGGSWKK